MFLNILDVAGLASFVVYNHLAPQKQTDKRRKFQTDLAIQLVTPHMEDRSRQTYVTRHANLKAAMAKFHVIVRLPIFYAMTT